VRVCICNVYCGRGGAPNNEVTRLRFLRMASGFTLAVLKKKTIGGVRSKEENSVLLWLLLLLRGEEIEGIEWLLSLHVVDVSVRLSIHHG